MTKTNHTISIKNLGPLKNINKFAIKNINLLIGESGSGKSMMATAIALFNDKQFIDLLLNRDHKDQKRDLKYIVQDYWHSYKDYEITYAYTKDLSITLSKQEQAVDIQYSKKLKTLIQEAQDNIKRLQKYEDRINTLMEEEDDEKTLQQLLKTIKLDENRFDVLDTFYQTLNILPMVFIPATRSFVSDFDEMRLRRLNIGLHTRGHYLELPEGNKTLRMFSDTYRRYLRTFDKLSDDYATLMRGKVIKDSNTDRLHYVVDEPKVVDKQTLPLSEISSGQKELFPILLILQRLIDTKKPHLLIIEEPEAHLFPKDQKAIFDTILNASKQTNSKILITTHSPYMPMIANNYIVAKNANYTALEEKFIDTNEIMVHKLVDGGSESIIDDDFIDGDYIESIADDICDEYDDILNSDKK